jgi:hypothetical protein
LCKAAFGSLIHSFDAKGTHFERTYMTKEILDAVPLASNDRQECTRKAVYAQKLVPYLPTNAPPNRSEQHNNSHFYSDFVPNSNRNKPQVISLSETSFPNLSIPFVPSSELMQWIRRDLLVLLCSEGMDTRHQLQQQIEDELAMLSHVISRACQEARSWLDLKQRLLAKLAPILASLPSHTVRRFVEEMGHFLASPYAHSIEQYDKHVRYHAPTIVLDAEEDDIIVIEDTGTRSGSSQARVVRNGQKEVIELDIEQGENKNGEKRECIVLDNEGEVVIEDDEVETPFRRTVQFISTNPKQKPKQKLALEVDGVEEMNVIVIEDDMAG